MAKGGKHNSSDVFVLHEGDGDLVIDNFDDGDRVMLDFNSYSDVLGPLGYHYDGQEFTDFTGLTYISVHAVDANNDGVMDTLINVNDDSITLLGVTPVELTSASLFGG